MRILRSNGWLLMDLVQNQSKFKRHDLVRFINEEHEVTIVLFEEGGIDFESLRLAWWVENTETGEFIREGDSPFLLQGNDISGLSLVGTGTMDLSVITEDILIDDSPSTFSLKVVTLEIRSSVARGNLRQCGHILGDGVAPT